MPAVKADEFLAPPVRELARPPKRAVQSGELSGILSEDKYTRELRLRVKTGLQTDEIPVTTVRADDLLTLIERAKNAARERGFDGKQMVVDGVLLEDV